MYIHSFIYIIIYLYMYKMMIELLYILPPSFRCEFPEAFCWDVASTFLSDMSRLACDAFAAPVLCQLLQLPTLQQELRRKLVAGLKGQGVVEVLVGIPY